MRKILVAGLFSAVTLFAGNYTVDKSHSGVAFKVKHMMISNVKGSFDQFDGKFEYDEKANTLKSLDGVIEVASVNTANAKRDGHLKSADFFDAANHPLITFKLTKVDGDEAYGELTMRGVTKKIELDFEAGGTGKNPWGKTVAGFSLSGKIKRSDFGLKWNKALEAGGMLVGDTIKLEIDVEGVKAN